MQLQSLLAAIIARRKKMPAERALLVGISGIDGSGKGFVANRVAKSLSHVAPGDNVAVIGVDGWLNLPHVRFAAEDCAGHFYRQALRFEEMFAQLVLPLRDHRRVDLEMDFMEETANRHRRHRYQYHDIDIILLEGIFLFQPQHRHYFDLTCWIDCSFQTALARAVRRCQEGLPPEETIRAFETIYFPAQRLHFQADRPRETADLILPNDGPETASSGREAIGTLGISNLLPKL